MSTEVTTELRFDPPGPGSWEHDAVHFPRPVTRYWAEMHPEPFKRGFRGADALLRDADRHARVSRTSNGFAYKTVVPVPEQRDPGALPAGRGGVRAQAVARAAARVGRDGQAAAIRKHRELQSVDPDALSDDELVEYLTRCRDHHAEMIYQHMRFTAAPSVPTGDFLAHVGDWTGLPPSELLGLLRGAAPVSAGASDELERLRPRSRRTPPRGSCSSPTAIPAEVLDALRSLDGEAGAAASAYLDLVGYRLLDGFDISGRYALELPDALLRAIRVAVEQARARGRRRRGARSPRSATRCPSSIGRSSTSCSRRRG